MQTLTKQEYKLKWLQKRLGEEKKAEEILTTLEAKTLPLEGKMAQVEDALATSDVVKPTEEESSL